MDICRVCDDFHSPKNMRVDLSTHITPLTMALSKMGVQQTVIARNSEISKLGDVGVYTIKPERPFSLIRAGLTAYKKIKEIDGKFDVIHFHNHAFSSILSKRSDLPPIIMTLHGSPIELFRNVSWSKFKAVREVLYFYYLTKFASKRLDGLVCVSPGVRESLIEEFDLDSKKVFSISPGVDLDTFYPKKCEKDIDILVVGRFVHVKRHVDVLEAAYILKKAVPGIRICFIGGDENDAAYGYILRVIRKHRLARNVEILKSVSQKVLCGVYQRSKILVLASVSESAPKVTLEAMACGVPVVTTDILGNKHVSIDKKTGFVVPIRNPEMLAEKVGVLLEDEKLRGKMGVFARRRIEKNFSWTVVALKYVELYNHLIAHPIR